MTHQKKYRSLDKMSGSSSECLNQNIGCYEKKVSFCFFTCFNAQRLKKQRKGCLLVIWINLPVLSCQRTGQDEQVPERLHLVHLSSIMDSSQSNHRAIIQTLPCSSANDVTAEADDLGDDKNGWNRKSEECSSSARWFESTGCRWFTR